MTVPLDQINGMPAFLPHYPMHPARYRNVRLHQVYFRAKASAIDRVLSVCFEPSDDGFCVATGLTVGWWSNYGPFDESFLTAKCTYRGERGYFTIIAFLNSRSSIPAGREIYGTPKVFADMRVSVDERMMYTDTMVAGVPIFSIRSAMERDANPSDLPCLVPSWRLKIIPRADGGGPDVMQVIDVSEVIFDNVIHSSQAGEGVIEFHPTRVHDMSGFIPVEYYGAHYIESEHKEGHGTVVHDFLSDG